MRRGQMNPECGMVNAECRSRSFEHSVFRIPHSGEAHDRILYVPLIRDASRHIPGFTLVELVFVMVLMAIVAGMALPRYANFLAHRRAEAAANRIASDIALAQRQAKFASSARTVTFDLAANSYTLVGIPHPDHPSQPYVVAMSDEPYAAVIVSADFGGDSTVVFNGYGMPDTSGSVVVRVGGYARTITVAADVARFQPIIIEGAEGQQE